MALVAHLTQSSCSSIVLKPNSWSKGVKLKPSVSPHFVGRTDNLLLLKHHIRIKSKPVISSRGRTFKVSSFKGNAQNGESECRDSSSKFSKTPLQLSCTQQGTEETQSQTPDVKKHKLSYASEDREGAGLGSLAIQKLFRKWLIVLRTQTTSLTVNENFEEETAYVATSKSEHLTVRTKGLELLKAAMVHFLRLDPAISLPLLIFIPLYLSVKVVHGAEVARELTPLWVLGPLVIALYVKIIKGLCSLYVWCFKQTIRVAKNIPAYCLLVYNCVAEGKLKEFLWAHFLKPIADNLDAKKLLKRKWKQLEEWAVDKYLDYVESIWPYYCRTIRFLKRANFI